MATIKIKVIPNAKKNRLKAEGDGFKVYLTAPAVDGKANKALLEFLAETWGCKKRDLQIIRGLRQREKIIKKPTSFRQF